MPAKAKPPTTKAGRTASKPTEKPKTATKAQAKAKAGAKGKRAAPKPRKPRVRKLTDQQQAFVDFYLINLNRIEAVKRAGYSDKYPDSIAFQLLKNPLVAAAVEAGMKERRGRVHIDQDYTIHNLKRVAELAMEGTPVFDKDGKPVLDADGNQIRVVTAAELREGAGAIKGVSSGRSRRSHSCATSRSTAGASMTTRSSSHSSSLPGLSRCDSGQRSVKSAVMPRGFPSSKG